MSTEQQHIQDLTQEIVENLGWGEVENWRTYDFEQLGEAIHEQTGVQLSSITLKRVLGRIQYHSQPSAHTLNTLAAYAGYPDWRGFVSTQQYANPLPISTKPITRFKPRLWGGMTIGLLGLIALVSGMMQTEERSYDPDAFAFTCVKVGEGIPASVIFSYDATQAAMGSQVEIQQNWDDRRRETVSTRDSIHTSIYYYPGYFEAKLVVNDHIMQEKPFMLPSKGWVCAVEQNPVPLYFPSDSVQREDMMGISPAQLERQGFHLASEGLYTNYSFVKRFEAWSDDFAFEAVIRNAGLGGVNICQKMEVILLFEGDAMVIPLAQKGCIADLNPYIPGLEIDGTVEDLSAFGTDTDSWTKLGIQAHNQQLTISVGEKTIRTYPYTRPAKRMVGMRLRFQGTGWVREVSVNGESLLGEKRI